MRYSSARVVLPGIHPGGEVNVESIREAYSDFQAAGDIRGEVDLDRPGRSGTVPAMTSRG